MILLDANILVYAYAEDYPQHHAVRDWLEEQLQRQPRVGFPWESLMAFMRLATNARILKRPSGTKRAWSQVESWLAADASWIPVATPRHYDIVRKMVQTHTLRSNDMPDVHLAALAMEHGLQLASADTGFARFNDLAWINPLQ